MTVVTLKVQLFSQTVDNWLEQFNPGNNHGFDTKIEVQRSAGGSDERGLLQYRMPALPADGVVQGARIKLYHYADNMAVNATVPAYNVPVEFSERDSSWNIKTANANWAAAGGDRDIFLHDIPIVAGAAEWVTCDLAVLMAHEDIKGKTIRVLLMQDSLGIADWCRFYSRHYVVDATKRPYLEVDVDTAGVTNLAIAPDTGDKRRPRLTWTPLDGINRSAQKIFRQIGGGGYALAATVGANDTSWTDTGIDAAANDGVQIDYALWTDNAYCTAPTSFPSNIVSFTRPTLTFFVSTVAGGLEGVNINVLDKVQGHVNFVVGGTLDKYYVDFGDGGDRWFDSTVSAYHNYTTVGAKVPYGRASNKEGYWSNLYATTAGHVAPNPQAIVPIPDLVIFPTSVKPFQKITLDAVGSYARESNILLATYQFDFSVAVFGLGAQPQISPLAKIYLKAPVALTAHLHCWDALGLTALTGNYNITVTNETVRSLTSLSGYDRATISGRKSENLDASDKVGSRGPDIIGTGGSVTKLHLQVLIRGATPEATIRTLRSWWEAGDLIDVAIPNDAGAAAVEIYRCRFANSTFELRGGEPNARHVEFDVLVIRKLVKIVDEDVVFVGGVGNVAYGPFADPTRDGDYANDVTVRTAAGGGGVNKPVSAVDYPADNPDSAFSEITLVDGAYAAHGFVTYWHEVEV